MTIKDKIIRAMYDVEVVLVDGFDDALVGTEWYTGRAIYDVELMIESLMREEGMEMTDAMEFLEYNVLTAYVGEMTPIFINTYQYD
jgi:predicted glycosyl hydrolase (DUF1957 family)